LTLWKGETGVGNTVLLVDYENVGHIDLTALPPGVRVAVFFGKSQRRVPTALLKSVAQLGERFVYVDISGQGRNALDFHIAFYLGEYLTKSPTTRCVILSGDTGFDPLVQHLQERKLSVQRVGALTEAFARVAPTAAAAAAAAAPRLGPKAAPKTAPKEVPAANQVEPLSLGMVVQWLSGTQKNKRPRKRKGLVAHLRCHFGQKVAESEIESLVDRLISDRKLIVTNGAVTYHF
jgi:PIN domain